MAKEIKLNDFVKAIIFLVTLQENYDTFRTIVSDFTHSSGLTSTNVERNFLIEEVNRKILDSTQGINALYARGRSKECGKFDDEGKSHNKS